MLIAHHREVCPRCGNLRSVCSDPNIDWHPHTVTCWPSATTEWALRQLQKKYEGAEPHGDQMHPLDGMSIFAAQVAPEDDPLA